MAPYLPRGSPAATAKMVPRALAARVRRLCGEDGREEGKEGEEVDKKVEEKEEVEEGRERGGTGMVDALL